MVATCKGKDGVSSAQSLIEMTYQRYHFTYTILIPRGMRSPSKYSQSVS